MNKNEELVVDKFGNMFINRKDKMDIFAIKDNVHMKYIVQRSTDVWLDIGACIGSFAVKVAKNVKHVHCYEPLPDNVKMIHRNVKLNDITNVTIKECVVSGFTNHKRTFSLAKKSKDNQNGTMLYRPKRKRIIVDSVYVVDEILHTGATCVKMDIEGGEIELLSAMFFQMEECKIHLDQLLVEFHFGKLNVNAKNDFELYRQWIVRLKKHFPYVVHRKTSTLGKKWGTQIFCHTMVDYIPPKLLN
jgi:FkbM family methyltransferase